jgi:hypothetical protein
MSWYRTPLWDLRADITSCRNVAVRNLRSYFCGSPSLTRGQVCNLRCNHSMVRVAQNPKRYFTVSSETPPTRSSKLLYDCRSVSQSVCLGIEHPCGTCDQILLLEGRTYFTTDGRSVSMSWYRAPLWDLRPDITSCSRSQITLRLTVSQYVLVSSTLEGLATRYYFLWNVAV